MADYPECGTCGKTFPAGTRARDNHCRSTGHYWPVYECGTCGADFGSPSARLQHMEALDHFAWDTESDEDYHFEYYDVECSQCYDTFRTDEDRDEHEHDDHLYCRDCDRAFMNHNNLRMHLNSRVHLGRNVSCPFCHDAYTTATGVAHHIESGSCLAARGMNREELYRLVRTKDPAGTITKKLIGWHGDGEYEVSDHSYNQFCAAWECYLCHRLFGQRKSLNQHINSPAHQQKLYHCPSRSCAKEFTTLAAIINHLESESCGYTRFSTIQRNIQDIVRGDRLIGF